MDDPIARHCAQIDRCNQRGGRMLSIVDLIEAGTISRELAAYALAAIGKGASFMVGALPGGAGKTTVMGALLNFAPADVELIAADGSATIQHAIRNPTPPRCCIGHEIGAGAYYAYLWGNDLRAYFDLPLAGHFLATNLHADTYEQAHDQVVHQNAVPEANWRRMHLIFFLSLRRSSMQLARRIESAWESDGARSHRPILGPGTPSQRIDSALVQPPDLVTAQCIIDELVKRNIRTIHDVRATILSLRAAAR
jgi:hypothetical protein